MNLKFSSLVRVTMACAMCIGLCISIGYPKFFEMDEELSKYEVSSEVSIASTASSETISEYTSSSGAFYESAESKASESTAPCSAFEVYCGIRPDSNAPICCPVDSICNLSGDGNQEFCKKGLRMRECDSEGSEKGCKGEPIGENCTIDGQEGVCSFGTNCKCLPKAEVVSRVGELEDCVQSLDNDSRMKCLQSIVNNNTDADPTKWPDEMFMSQCGCTVDFVSADTEVAKGRKIYSCDGNPKIKVAPGLMGQLGIAIPSRPECRFDIGKIRGKFPHPINPIVTDNCFQCH